MNYEIKETEEMCANCRYFIQHYRRAGEFDYRTICSGHCTYPRSKYRKPWDNCKYFKQRNFIEGDLIRNLILAEEQERKKHELR